MATCLKTGVDVYIIEYNATVRADVHDADGSLVINYEPNSWNVREPMDDAPHARVLIGRGYLNQNKGIIVNPASYAMKLK